MLIDADAREDVFAQVPKLAAEIDPELRKLDTLLDDDALYQQVRNDFGKRYQSSLVHGRHSTPVEVLLRMLLCKHLYQWSYKECEGRVADSLVLRWFCRVAFHEVPDGSTLFLPLGEDVTCGDGARARRPGSALSQAGESDEGAQVAPGCHLRATHYPSPHRQWVVGGQRAGTLAAGAARQAVGQRAALQRAGGLP